VAPPLKSTVRVPPARSRRLVVRLVRGLWTLPTSLLGHLLGFLVSGQAPTRVGGPAARGWLYPIRTVPWLRGFGAVTIGHAILHRPRLFEGEAGRLVLAHELAHTRQHDRLGPLYLPAHILAQVASALLTSWAKEIHTSLVHDRNPLEETWICLGVRACHDLGLPETAEAHPAHHLVPSLLAALGA